MKKHSIPLLITYIFGAVAIVTAVGIWIFLTFFFQGTLNKVVIPKIQEAAFTATDGRFTLTLDKISYVDGVIVCNTFILSRAAYDSNEHGIVLERLTIDSVRFEGVSWWDVLWGNKLELTTLQMNAPQLYMVNIDSANAVLQNTYIHSAAKNNIKASDMPIISFDSILLRDVTVYMPKSAGKSVEPTYRNITIKLTDFLLDTKDASPQPLVYSRRIDFELPRGSYSLSDSMYSVEVRGIRGSVSDSLISIDSISYTPNYNEQIFADMHKYIQGRLEFSCSNINVRGINFSKFFSGEGLKLAAFEAGNWRVEYYGDRRKPRDPHPPDAMLPHTILSTITTPITLDSIILNNGMIRHRERSPGSVRPSLLTFTQTRVFASPFSTDTLSKSYNVPMTISVNALFMGVGKVIGAVVYPLHQKSFDLNVDATVGAFDLRVINSYIVTNERKEIAKGMCLGGELRMNVRNGIGTTTVSPRYKDLDMKVLSTHVKEERGLFERLQSFVANTFVLRGENINTADNKAISGTTTYVRKNREEFFEFIWLALLRSIQKVIGF